MLVQAVLFSYRSGIALRDLPERFGDFRAVHASFSQWADGGIWQKGIRPSFEDADDEFAMIDATIVRAPPA